MLAAVLAAGETDWLPVIVTGILSGGGVAFVGALITGVGTLRSGARTREREVVGDLVQRADTAEARERSAVADRDYWRDLAARYRYQLRSGGIDPNPADPEPPSERIEREELEAEGRQQRKRR